MHERNYPSNDAHPSLQITNWTLDEFIGIRDIPLTGRAQRLNSETRTRLPEPHGSWFGGIESWDQVDAIMRQGWREGAERLSNLGGSINAPQARSRRRVTQWADTGDDLHLDRALAGDWDRSWRTSRRQIASGVGYVEIVAAFGGNQCRDADELFWCGAASVVLADILESAGYAVKLTAAHLGFNSHGASSTTLNNITLKDYTEPLRVDSVAAVLCHAGIFRTLGFHMITFSDWTTTLSLGRHADFSEKRSLLEARGEWPAARGAIVVDSVYSKSDAISTLNAALAQLETGEI